MNCPKCGNPLAPNMKFCAKCGTPAEQPKPAPQTLKTVGENAKSTKPKKNVWKGIAISAIAIILVMAIVLGIIFIPDLISKDKNGKGANSDEAGISSSLQANNQADNNQSVSSSAGKLTKAIEETLFNSEELEITFSTTSEKWMKSSYIMLFLFALTTPVDGNEESVEQTAVSAEMKVVFGNGLDSFSMDASGSAGLDGGRVTIENGIIRETDGTEISIYESLSELEASLKDEMGIELDLDAVLNNALNGTLDKKAFETLADTYLIPYLEKLGSEYKNTQLNLPEYKVIEQHIAKIFAEAVANGDIVISEETDNGIVKYIVDFSMVDFLDTAVHYLADDSEMSVLLEVAGLLVARQWYSADEIVEYFEKTFSAESIQQIEDTDGQLLVARRKYTFAVDDGRLTELSVAVNGENLVTYTIKSK